jgi:hypothetical protein
MDVTLQYALALTAIIGLVNGIDLVQTKQWYSVVKFGLAIAAGLLFGFLHWFGLPSMEVGLLVALSSSGLYKLTK